MAGHQKSDVVTRLIRTVERLTEEDQGRIFRIVDLLTIASRTVQRRTYRMLKELLDTKPDSIFECTAGVDEVIEYLEDNVISAGEYLNGHSQADNQLTSRQRN